jgi:hypothetical protein
MGTIVGKSRKSLTNPVRRKKLEFLVGRANDFRAFKLEVLSDFDLLVLSTK